jgi:hypothetical protein
MPHMKKRAIGLALLIGLQSIACSSRAAAPAPAEPLVGVWRLQQQEIDGQRSNFQPLTLQISQAGEKLTFAFSVPTQDIYVVTLRYTVRLDGSTGDIEDGNGQKVGSVQMNHAGARAYTLTMKGPNRPDAQGKLTLADDKTLVSESAATQSGRTIHSTQTFSRD